MTCGFTAETPDLYAEARRRIGVECRHECRLRRSVVGMCGCEAHSDRNAHCTCRCPEHKAKREEYAQRFFHPDDLPEGGLLRVRDADGDRWLRVLSVTPAGPDGYETLIEVEEVQPDEPRP